MKIRTTIFQRKPIGDHFNPTWVNSDKIRILGQPLSQSTVSRTHSEQFSEFFGLSTLHSRQFHSTMKVNASAISSCRVAFAEGIDQSTSAKVVSAGSEVPELSPVSASHDPQGCPPLLRECHYSKIKDSMVMDQIPTISKISKLIQFTVALACVDTVYSHQFSWFELGLAFPFPVQGGPRGLLQGQVSRACLQNENASERHILPSCCKHTEQPQCDQQVM